ncbi:hypothetical protein [Clostridium acidisoli]|nr:hypothetical protein [Clostridium acidisoli]
MYMIGQILGQIVGAFIGVKLYSYFDEHKPIENTEALFSYENWLVSSNDICHIR